MTIILFCLIFASIAFPAYAQTTEQGVDNYRKGDYVKAIDILQAVTTADKNDKVAWTYLGASLLLSGKKYEAAKAFEKGWTSNKPVVVPGDDGDATVTDKPRPHYTDLARQNNTTGTVRLAFERGGDGKIGFVFAYKSLPDGLTDASITAVRSIKFTPATKNGKPVTTVSYTEHTFSIF